MPELTYKEMVIQYGQIASVKWYDAVTGTISKNEAEKIYEGLLKYCCLDTLVMVKI